MKIKNILIFIGLSITLMANVFAMKRPCKKQKTENIRRSSTSMLSHISLERLISERASLKNLDIEQILMCISQANSLAEAISITCKLRMVCKEFATKFGDEFINEVAESYIKRHPQDAKTEFIELIHFIANAEDSSKIKAKLKLADIFLNANANLNYKIIHEQLSLLIHSLIKDIEKSDSFKIKAKFKAINLLFEADMIEGQFIPLIFTLTNAIEELEDIKDIDEMLNSIRQQILPFSPESATDLPSMLLPGINDLKSSSYNLPIELIEMVIKIKLKTSQELKNNTALLNAIMTANKDEVEQLLKKRYIDVNVKDNNGNTGLILAVICLNTRILLNKGPLDPKIQIIHMLLQAGADPNITGYAKTTALIWAAKYGNAKVVKMLLDNGAKINLEDLFGRSALIHAVLVNRQYIVNQLLYRGANPDQKDKSKEGNTALGIAAMAGCLESMEILLSAGVNIDHQNSNGHTALHLAVACNSLEETRQLKVVELLINYNANMNITNKFRNTALILAILNNKKNSHRLNLVKMLLAADANPNIQNYQRDTALTGAITRNYPETVKILLYYNADKSIQNKYGDTPLDLANKLSNYRIKNLLEGQEDNCIICLAPIDDNEGVDFELPCKHNTFHTACLNEWIGTSNKKTCPICRGPLTKS